MVIKKKKNYLWKVLPEKLKLIFSTPRKSNPGKCVNKTISKLYFKLWWFLIWFGELLKWLFSWEINN